MQTLESLRRRIDNAEDMQSVVSAMKVLAVVSIRQFERALESLADYNRTIEMGMQIALRDRPHDIPFPETPPGGKLCALVFGSEQGLSGQFNEQIVTWAVDQLAELGYEPGEPTVIAMGEHVVYRLRAADCPAVRTFPIPGSVKAMGRVVQDLYIYIDELRREGLASQVMLFYHKPLTGASYRPHRLRLFPLDPAYLRELEERGWDSRSLPVFTMPWQELFSHLIRQHLFAALEQAFAESLLSENASRLLSMQVAEKNIAEYLDELKHQFNNQRQTEITAELLDIVAGSEALHEEEDQYLDLA